jgi:DNA-binding response OmpR family regulator
MRPARQILLIGENEDKLSPLRYVLRNSSDSDKNYIPCYQVTTVHSAQEALDALEKRDYHVMLCQSPIASIHALLSDMKDVFTWVPVLILTEKPPPEGKRYADHILYKPRMRVLLERIKDATAHKGPKKGSPAAMRCGHNRKKPVQSVTSVERVEVVA